MNPVVFASGLSRPGAARPFIRTGAPVGFVAGELSKRTMRGVARSYAGAGGQVFIDSGAFSAFTKGKPVDFDEILAIYREIAEGCACPWNLFIVAPDGLGEQSRTLELLERYRGELLELSWLGVQILVPLQKGELSGAALVGAVDDALDHSIPWIPAVPFCACPWTDEEVLDFLEETWVERLHLLGGGLEKVERIAELAAAVSPESLIQGDATRIRAWVGKGRPLEGEIEARRQELLELAADQGLLETDDPKADAAFLAKIAEISKDYAVAARVREESGTLELEAAFRGVQIVGEAPAREVEPEAVAQVLDLFGARIAG